MTNEEYRTAELARFLRETEQPPSKGYYATAADFCEWVQNSLPLLVQIEWIENGSYGAGACFYLRNVVERLTPRMNAEAAVGQACLRVWAGSRGWRWGQLDPATQEAMSEAVQAWMAQEREWAA